MRVCCGKESVEDDGFVVELGGAVLNDGRGEERERDLPVPVLVSVLERELAAFSPSYGGGGCVGVDGAKSADVVLALPTVPPVFCLRFLPPDGPPPVLVVVVVVVRGGDMALCC